MAKKTKHTEEIEKRRLKISLIPPSILLSILWFVKIVEIVFHKSFVTYGIYPLKPEGLKGILFSPFIHGSLEHLYHNSLPILILFWALLYFYHRIAWKVILFIWLFSGLGTWLFGRPSYHIGMSSIIYGLFTFLFFSGLFRKNNHLTAVSLLVIFLYGSMVWGVFPEFTVKDNISWEGHAAGAVTGLVLAFIYREEKTFAEWQSALLEKDPDENIEKHFWFRASAIHHSLPDVPPLPVKIKMIYPGKHTKTIRRQKAEGGIVTGD